MIVLGIETSCDETSIAIVRKDRSILSNSILSQINVHQSFGGVVPEIAAREHLKSLSYVFTQAFEEAAISWSSIDAIGATCGPGLIGGVLVGATAAKAMALAQEKPFVPVNHLEAHALTARLSHGVSYPYLLLLVSGGHTLLVHVKGFRKYEVLGENLDDALGETFDKTAKLLGLQYPGGPEIEKLALEGDPNRFLFPYPLEKQQRPNFSFSGLKTAVRQTFQKIDSCTIQDKKDIAASFQCIVQHILKGQIKKALHVCADSVSTLVVAGGVASNQYIRSSLQDFCGDHHLQFIAPPPRLCTDNAAMIAWVAIEHLLQGGEGDYTFKPRPRWPLEELCF